MPYIEIMRGGLNVKRLITGEEDFWKERAGWSRMEGYPVKGRYRVRW